jgi:DNA mismatch repair protein MutS2
MNQHTLRVLEYDKIKDIVAGYAASGSGRAVVAELQPATDSGMVAALLEETEEVVRILRSGERPPLEGIHDIRQAVEKLGVPGSMLSPAELLASATTLGSGRRLKAFFQRFEGEGAGKSAMAAPRLCARAAHIRPLKHIEDAVFAAIDERAEVRDSASPALRRIRKQVNRTRDEILDRMSRILQDGGMQKVIQEPVVTIRDDRYVLPLKPNFRQGLKGVVHGQSGSRATLFVEPLEVLEQNNRLAELRMEEREEVERILRELTSLLAQEATGIAETVRALAEIDAVCARARFGIDYGATVPEIPAGRRIRLRRAAHPLLVRKRKAAAGSGPDSVPNDIELGNGSRALIISGPNAGGKTVILKTMGLLCLMAQSGLPVTAEEGSEIPVFRAVFADIGDEQSLEQDLSTFSSHVRQMAEILRCADRDSLVLLDELGSGTDPAEGAALGAAVLSSLLERGCMTVITTHHSALKLFGARTSGALNAAMEFDPETLKPTYRIIPGRPGRSYGLDMAVRLGVPDQVISDARSRLGEHEAGLDRLLEQIESDSRQLRFQKEHIEKHLAAAEEQRLEAEALTRAAREEVRALKAKAREEARGTLDELRQKLRELSRASSITRAEATRESSGVASLAKRLEPERPEPEDLSSGAQFEPRPGERVRIPKLRKTGVVIASRKGTLELDVDGKKLKLPAREVQPLGRDHGSDRPEAGAAPGWGAELSDNEGLPDRLNILGFRVDEAKAEVERFIDRASLSGLLSVAILHGTGTGALKSAVAECLESHPLVAATRPGKQAEGGAGVTVAELKK